MTNRYYSTYAAISHRQCNRLKPLGENEKHKMEMEKSKYVNKSKVYIGMYYNIVLDIMINGSSCLDVRVARGATYKMVRGANMVAIKSTRPENLILYDAVFLNAFSLYLSRNSPKRIIIIIVIYSYISI